MQRRAPIEWRPHMREVVIIIAGPLPADAARRAPRTKSLRSNGRRWCGWSRLRSPQDGVGCAHSYIVPVRTEMTPMLPVHPWSASSFIQVSNRATGASERRPVFAIENSVVNGGSKDSDTAKSQVGQINEIYIYASSAVLSRRRT